MAIRDNAISREDADREAVEEDVVARELDVVVDVDVEVVAIRNFLLGKLDVAFSTIEQQINKLQSCWNQNYDTLAYPYLYGTLLQWTILET